MEKEKRTLMDKLYEVENILGYEFKDKSLLRTALTHSSYANDYLGDSNLSNERLEYLGDALLDFVVGEELFKRFPEKQEGFLSKLRSEIVCEESLAKAAFKLKLNEYILLGKGEENLGGKHKNSIISDLVESIIAAVYLDGGFEKGYLVVHRVMDETIDLGFKDLLSKDYKSSLQEYCQSKNGSSPYYAIIGQTGPDHDPRFEAEALVLGKSLGKGFGKTKKEAENMAAKDALDRLKVK